MLETKVRVHARGRLACGLLAVAAAAAILCSAGAAWAGVTTGACLAAKLKAAGELRRCRANEEAKLLLGKAANAAKCPEKFAAKLAKLDLKAAKAGVACRYQDNGDGTVTDFDTGLQWEQKQASDSVQYFPNPHDGDNLYTWGADQLADGTVFTEFLGRLNGSVAPLFDLNPCLSEDGIGVSGGFANHCDWRLPTIRELATLVDTSAPGCGVTDACIDPVFGPTREVYWSSTTNPPLLDEAWTVIFLSGSEAVSVKSIAQFARAVRGGW